MYMRLYIYMCVCVCISSSSSFCRAASMDISDPLSPLLSIIHHFWQVVRATSRIHTELLYVGSSWSPCFCIGHVKGVHRRTSLNSSSLLLQLCLACLVRLTLILFVMGGRCSTPDALWGVASRTCSKLRAAFLCSCRQTFSPSV